MRLLEAEQNGYTVSAVVNTRAYHYAFEKMPVSRVVSHSLYVQSGRILQRATGRDAEYLVAVDAKTGALVADNLGREGYARSTAFIGKELEAVSSHLGSVITVHNHPHSYGPSYQDVVTASRNPSIAASVVLGHDGSVWYLSAPSGAIAGMLERAYNLAKDQLGGHAEVHALDELVSRAGKVGLTWIQLR